MQERLMVSLTIIYFLMGQLSRACSGGSPSEGSQNKHKTWWPRWRKYGSSLADGWRQSGALFGRFRPVEVLAIRYMPNYAKQKVLCSALPKPIRVSLSNSVTASLARRNRSTERKPKAGQWFVCRPFLQRGLCAVVHKQW